MDEDRVKTWALLRAELGRLGPSCVGSTFHRYETAVGPEDPDARPQTEPPGGAWLRRNGEVWTEQVDGSGFYAIWLRPPKASPKMAVAPADVGVIPDAG